MIQIARKKIALFGFSNLQKSIWSMFLGVILVFSQPAISDSWEEIAQLNQKVTESFQKGDYTQMEQYSRKVYKLAVASFGKGSIDTVLLQGQIALSLFHQGKYSEAIETYQEIIKIQENKLSNRHPDTLASLNGLAATLDGQGNYKDAEKIHRQVLENRRNTLGENDPLTLRSLNNLADTLSHQGRLDEAEVLLRQRLKILATVPPQSLPGIRFDATQLDIVTTKNNLAIVLYKKGQIAESYQLLSNDQDGVLVKQKAMYQTQDHPEIAKTHGNLASLLRELGKLDEAIKENDKALAIRTNKLGEEHRSTINSRNQKALLLYQKAKQNDTTDTQRQTLLTSAEQECLKALAAMQKSAGKEHVDTTPILNTLGLILRTQGRLAESEDQFRRALDIRRNAKKAWGAGTSDSDEARLLDNLAATLKEQKRYQDAEKYYRESIAVAEASGASFYLLSANAGLGAVLVQNNRLAEAIGPYDHAVQALDQLFANTRGLSEEDRYIFVGQHTHIYREFIQLLLKLHQQSPQAGYDRKALEIASRQQSRLFTELLRQARVKDWAGDARFNELKAQHDSLQTQLAVLGEKRATMSPTEPDASATKTNLSREIAERERQIKEVEDRLWRDYPRYMELGAPKPVNVEALQRLLRPGEAVWTIVMLPEQTALFVVTPERLTLMTVVVAQKILEEQARGIRETLQGVLDAYAKGYCGNGGNEKCEGDRNQAIWEMTQQLKKLHPETLYQLYQHLLAPVEPFLAGAHTLFIVADGALYNLPLELLVRRYESPQVKDFDRLARDKRITLDTIGKYYAGLDYADKTYRFHYLPSLAALVAQRQHPKPLVAPARDLVAFADPVFTVPASATSGASARTAKDGSPTAALEPYTRSGAWRSNILSPLPDTAKEVHTIALRLPSDRIRIYLGREAAERTVKQLDQEGQLQGLRYLYFSTHGFLGGELLNYYPDRLLPELKAEPALALTLTGEPPPNDGFLTMSEVLKLNLNTDWAILSACNTAGETASRGEGFVGLTRAFLYAGARRLLVSHWYVESSATRDLMIHTFDAAGKTGDFAEGARSARRALRDQPATAHPYFWAPFVVVGD